MLPPGTRGVFEELVQSLWNAYMLELFRQSAPVEMECLASGRRRSYPNKRAISGVMQQYAAPLSTII